MSSEASEPLAPPTAACLDAEALAAWAEQALPASAMAAADAHMAGCARCQAMMAAFVRSEPPAAARLPFWRRSPAAWLAPIAAIAAAAALVLWTRHASVTPDTLPPPVRTVAVATPALPTPAPTPAPAPAPVTSPAAPEPRTLARQPQPTAEPAAKDLGGGPPAPAAAPATPPATPPAAAAAAARADASAGMSVMAQSAPANPTDVVAEFAEADAPAAAGGSGFGAGGSGRGAARAAGGRGGGGGGGRGALAAQAPAAAGSPRLRWRILSDGRLERSADNGASWTRIALDGGVHLTSGIAPVRGLCWVVGRGGVVLRSTDGQPFTRITFPASDDLLTVMATDPTHATVTTVSGDIYVTTDGQSFVRKGGTRFAG